MSDKLFSFDEAQALMRGTVLGAVEELVPLRAELTAAVVDLRRDKASAPIADIKAMEARLAEILDRFRGEGIQVKGWAPLLLDFPSMHDGREILYCWLEGDRDLQWYHDAEHGFAGRRPVSELR